MKSKYDIIIVGGGTAGCACAYVAGKLGMSTLVIEKNSYLGGTMTAGLVTPAMNPNTSQKLNTDFFEKLMKNLNKIGGQITYPDGNIGWFNPELMKSTLEQMLSDAGVDVLLDTELTSVETEGNYIKGVYLIPNNIKNTITNDAIHSDNQNMHSQMLLEYIETKYVVDGTGDAKIFEKLNLKFLNNFEKKLENKYQPVNLRFIMSGINLKEFSDWIMALDPDREVTTSYTIDGNIYMSTAYTWDKDKKWALEPVFRLGLQEGLIFEADCNYFQLFSIPGMPSSLAFNCPRLLKLFDPTDKEEHAAAVKQGRERISRLSQFMKAKFKGFENAKVSSIADALGVRVSNRIIGKYTYTIDDLKSGKVFDNPVLISKYPVDVHSAQKDGSILDKREVEYMLPIESLMSKDYDNLFAIGRCLSADFYAQGALRIIPSCFSMGEGLAKYLVNLAHEE